jgi:hypothetical protein
MAGCATVASESVTGWTLLLTALVASVVGSAALARGCEASPTVASVVVSGVGAVERSGLGAMLLRVAVGSVAEGSTTDVSAVVSGVGAVERSGLGAMLLRVPVGSVALVRVEPSAALGKAEAVDWTASVVGITFDVLAGSSESPGAGVEATPSVGEVVGTLEGSIESVVGCAAVDVSAGEVGVVEESSELVVGAVDAVSVGVGVGAAVSAGLTVGETAASVEVGAVEVSTAGVAGSVLVGATVSVGLTVGETAASIVVGAVEVSATGAVASVVVAAVSVAVARGSLTVPPLQSAVISFAIRATQFPTTEEHGDNAGRRPTYGGQIP